MTDRKLRILLAKPGLDGHDRGAKIVALALRDAGLEVIYTGLHQSLEQILQAAIQESVDIIGLSIMSGAHLPICRRLIEMVRMEGLDDVRIIVGGVIPHKDIAQLKEIGVAGVFPGGTPFVDIVTEIYGLFGMKPPEDYLHEALTVEDLRV
jgi:methylmalonyl-CoA mutase C-terminal domain/subunit